MHHSTDSSEVEQPAVSPTLTSALPMPHFTWLPSSSQHSLGSAANASRSRQEGVTVTTVVMEARTRLASHSSLRAMEKAHAVFSSPWPARSDAGQCEASEEFWRRNELRLEAYWKEER